ncbi:hypothetical protein [Palleronia caenipelagi]|uniref:Uncharacterized protein n=1 Tax=Palleronia caenipelagi TaxID=2489174 RepID=A0A547PYB5_9RHOB|nr:hypothetical protein [Palleronia caenipelagi]TRD19048.1 hypothetical protein FEV53_11195 [Palleronia caenipelagi]
MKINYLAVICEVHSGSVNLFLCFSHSYGCLPVKEILFLSRNPSDEFQRFFRVENPRLNAVELYPRDAAIEDERAQVSRGGP